MKSLIRAANMFRSIMLTMGNFFKSFVKIIDSFIGTESAVI